MHGCSTLAGVHSSVGCMPPASPALPAAVALQTVEAAS